MKERGLSSFFYTHGFLCASHPVEVLLLCITGTVCLLTLNIYDATHSSDDGFTSTAEKVSWQADKILSFSEQFISRIREFFCSLNKVCLILTSSDFNFLPLTCISSKIFNLNQCKMEAVEFRSGGT